MTATPHLRDLERALAELPENVVGEILFGRLVTQPRPASPHAFSASGLGAIVLSAFQHGVGGPGGWFIVDEPELQLGPHVVVPDLAGWRLETMPEYPHVARFHVVPDWACEVLSPSTEHVDRDEKKLIYGANGVEHLWLLDPIARTIEVSRSERGHWHDVGTYRGDELARIDPFAAIEMPVGKLWSR